MFHFAWIVFSMSAVAFGQTTHYVRSSNELTAAVRSLAAGDVVTLAPGTYRLPSLQIRNAHGWPDRWIVLRSEPGQIRATIVGTDSSGAVLDLQDCSHLRFEDLEITSQGSGGVVHGIQFPQQSTSRHVVFDRCRIHGVTGNGLLSSARLLEHLELIGSEIDHCGDSGINLGHADPWDARIAAHTRISGCYIHHTSQQPPRQWSYGIHIKPWSYATTIEDTVIHDAATTSGALIGLYGPSVDGNEPVDRWNIVRRNVLWDSDPNHSNWSYEGIFVTNSAIVENNIVSGVRHGISVETYYRRWMGTESPVIDNLTIRNNTVYHCRNSGISVRHAWAMAPTCAIVNNASLMVRTYANSYLFQPDLPTFVTFTANGFFGPRGGVSRGLIRLGDPTTEFVQTGALPANLYPVAGSGMRNAASQPFGSPSDFNGTRRPAGALGDLGAYEWTGAANPGWRVAAGFKPAIAPLRPAFQEITASLGGQADFELHAPPSSPYLMLVSAAGPSSEGPPVVPDPWTSAAWSQGLASVFVGYVGTVPGTGVARMQLRVPPIPLPVGATLYHGAMVLAGSLESSNAVRVVLGR